MTCLLVNYGTIEDGQKSKRKESVEPPSPCSSLDKPDKETAIAKHETRFSSHS